jgi:prepilin-type N-terminal cleavage/methylation domain-containing protein
MTYITRTQKGFTLIETLVGIFILALTIGSLLTLTAGGFFSIRYAKNDIVASNLLQESLEYIRNTRDSGAQRALDSDYRWGDWILDYENADCNTSTGCTINPYATDPADKILACETSTGSDGQRTPCERLSFYEHAGIYTYTGSNDAFDAAETPIPTTFMRTITFDERTNAEGDPEVIVTAMITWKNGTHPKRLSQSIILTSWNLGI